MTALKIAITGLLLYLFIRRTDFRGVTAALSQLSFALIALLALLNILGVFISAYKWRMLLPEARFGALLVACFASYYIALLLPGQVAQEAAKAYYLSLGRAPRLHLIAASVLVDKIASILGLLIVGCIGIAFTETRLPMSLTISFVVAGAVTVLALFSLRNGWAHSGATRFVMRLERRFPRQRRISNGISRLFEAWHLYSKNIALLSGNILVGVLYQSIGVIMLYLLSRQLHLGIGFFDWSWIVGVLTLALFLPLTIGGLGIREGTLIGILGMLGYRSETAIALSLAAFSFVLMLAVIGAVLSFTIKRPQQAAP